MAATALWLNILPELKTVLPNADFVIEGYVDPTEPLRDEGPFGDHGPLRGKSEVRNPKSEPTRRGIFFGLLPSFGFRHSAFGFVQHVTAITHRKDAVYPATIVGIPPMEDFY